MGPILKRVFQTPYFRVALTHDVYTVELCGALKVSSPVCNSCLTARA